MKLALRWFLPLFLMGLLFSSCGDGPAELDDSSVRETAQIGQAADDGDVPQESAVDEPEYTEEGDPVPQTHPIDQRMADCIDQDYSNMGMRECTNKAHEEWDALLNENYQKLMGSLTETQQKALQESQRQWIAWRDKEFDFISEQYDSRDGTMWYLIADGARMEVVKNRALELASYIIPDDI